MTIPLYVTKASGEQVLFDPQKLRQSLANAGADEKSIDEILIEVNRILVPGISTKKIYNRAFSLLRKFHRPTAARFKLKRAIMELGPSGFPFEKFVGEVLKDMGYQVKVGVIEQGRCITHEVDVIAENEEERIAIECKFGNSSDKKISSRVSLYINSRFHDLSQAWDKNPKWAEKKHIGWIVTNTAFTKDALTYGTCAGLRMISWNHPKVGSLKDLIDECHLYPVTALVSLTKAEKRQIIAKDVVLVRDLFVKQELLDLLHISNAKKNRVVKEMEDLLC
jgi:Holliday junction resolvase-like predicted endonuclease